MKKNLSILVSVFSVILLIFLFFWHEFESEYFEIVFYSVVCIEILITVLGFMLNSIFEEKENKTDSLQDFFSDTLEGEKSAVKKTEKEKIESFAYDLSKITFFEINESVNSPLGFAVLIYLKTNEVIVLSCTLIGNLAHGMVALFTAEGEYIRHIGIFADRPAFERLLNNYFGV